MSHHDTLTLREALRSIQYEAASLADAQVIALQALNATYPARAALSATQSAQAKQSDWGAQQFKAPVYPPDGTESPFTVINLGSGKVQMGDSIHDGRLPALWFGINGQGMGHEETMNREAHPGETLAVVTFANVEGLDVLLDVIQRIRREKFPEAQAAQSEPAEHWHRLYLEKCQQYNDRVAQLGGVIEGLEAEAAQGAGEVVAWLHQCRKKQELKALSFSKEEPGLSSMGYKPRPLTYADTQPAAGADVLDAQRYRWLRDQHQGQTEQAYDAEGFPLPQEPTAIACTVFKPGRDLCLEPISCTPGELDAHIDAAIAASGRKS